MPDGKLTLRQHYTSALEQGDAHAALELKGPPCPPELAYLFGWYRELSEARGSSGFGPLPISYTELSAWSALTGRLPDAFDVRCLRALDRAFLVAMSRAKANG